MAVVVRPRIHFTPQQHWMNDPNGLIWLDGEFHLFFQHNPHGNAWGNMSWGHAVSTDLLTWTELPIALWYDDHEAVFSGSVVLDKQNSSGLGSVNQPALIAIYTSASARQPQLQRQALAFSVDHGRSWTKYVGNPVLDEGLCDFRDPAVRWNSHRRCWIMVLARSTEQRVGIYSSHDLLNWQHESDFGPAGAVDGAWECPDLFELPVDGDASITRWVLIVSMNPGGLHGGSGTQYFVGVFDGHQFVADASDTQWLDLGTENYAGVTFNDTPDGRRILIGWMNTWQSARRVVSTPWNGSMTIPRELLLKRRSLGYRIAVEPIHEVRALHRQLITPSELESGGGVRWELAYGAYDLELVLTANERTELTLDLGGEQRVQMRFLIHQGRITATRAGSGILPEEFDVHLETETCDTHNIRVIIDYGSIELFVNSQSVTIGTPLEMEHLTLYCRAATKVHSALLHHLG